MKTSRLKGKELSDLLEAGHVPIPSKWADTMKNIHEKHKPDYVPEFKSRLVSCGNFEDAEAVRTDAHTSNKETHALVAVFAACHGVPLFSWDIKNAYFQAMPIDRTVIMRQLQGGLPGVDPKHFCSSEYLFTDSAIAVEVFGKRSTTTVKRLDCEAAVSSPRSISK